MQTLHIGNVVLLFLDRVWWCDPGCGRGNGGNGGGVGAVFIGGKVSWGLVRD